ncbi:vWA domain-containing protein [Congregibacter litoralis]|uniref:Mg-chelatase subunit ChlD n=1 Tax=Congregibacter litoralis KT71 TaxID=314285 RepID=A4ADR8_9GAMM|nr:VWA domain-containing protein [Congregibacter litoralis]EAQ95876.1 Mg-chelatase subunit ChlD [Congregibacter litoralis KT71]
MIEFTLPWAFALLALPLLVRWLTPPHRESQDSLQVPYFQRLVLLSGETPRSGASVLRRRRMQGIVSILGWCLLVLAAARPEWVGDPINIEKSARDLMLALDLSGSMDARDFRDAEGHEQNRLTAAKDVLEGFAAQREGDRLGLIVFGNAAYLQAPFTDDRETWQTLLEESEVAMAGQSTALGDAIGLAISIFQASDTTNRVLIVLTDGNDTGSRVPPRDAATIAAANDVTIYTVAVGDPATIGEEALDLETLNAVAETTGGASFQALDTQALEKAYDEINRLEPAKYDSLSYRPRSSLFHIPLGLFAALYLLALPLFALLSLRRQESVHA